LGHPQEFSILTFLQLKYLIVQRWLFSAVIMQWCMLKDLHLLLILCEMMSRINQELPEKG